jgi:hypothetical protein
LNAHWLKRLEAARDEYHRALGDLKALSKNIPAGSLAPDHALKVEQASLRESTTRSEYLRVLQVFNDLVIRGKVPEDS